MSYIFNIGGYPPENALCIMIRGKVSGITIEDVRELAKENGIRKAEAIINVYFGPVSLVYIGSPFQLAQATVIDSISMKTFV